MDQKFEVHCLTWGQAPCWRPCSQKRLREWGCPGDGAASWALGIFAHVGTGTHLTPEVWDSWIQKEPHRRKLRGAQSPGRPGSAWRGRVPALGPCPAAASASRSPSRHPASLLWEPTSFCLVSVSLRIPVVVKNKCILRDFSSSAG